MSKVRSTHFGPSRWPRAASAPRNPREDLSVREVVLDLWAATRADWGYAADRLARTFRETPGLDAAKRGVIAETLYGMIRQARRTDFALEAAAPKLPTGRARDFAHYLAYRVLAGEIETSEARRGLPKLDWDAVRHVDARIGCERDPARRFALAQSLPDWLAARFHAEYGPEAAALATALNRPPPQTIRANLLKVTREDLQRALLERDLPARAAPLSRSGLILETRTDLFALDLFREGLFEAQDEASQLVAELTAPPPHALTVDYCAGAGGKTLALGALMHNQGVLVALDTSARRLEALRLRARRAGLSNMRALELTARGSGEEGEAAWPAAVKTLTGRAARVLVDVPCSGLGALRRNPEARWRLTEEALARLPAVQLGIARRARELVKPGGRLVYATCSVLADENERVAEALLADPGWQIVTPKEILGRVLAERLCDVTGRYLKLLPQRHGTDGFFAVVLRKA